MAAQDPQRLETLNQRTNAANLHGAWDRGTRGPAPEEVRPWVWHWDQVLPCLLEAGEIVPIDDRMRMRTIGLVNPTRKVAQATTRTMSATMQHLGPGEITEAHRHTRTSLYFMLQGENTFTTAEGEQQWMEPGDLLIQPSWTWHGTQNDGSQPAVWLTVQDTGIINTLDAEFRDSYPDGKIQPVTKPDGYHLQRLGVFGTSANLETEGVGLPVKYSWKDSLAMLQSLADAEEADPYDGAILEYKNPHTGGAAAATMSAHLQMLQPGEATKSHRHTGNSVYLVARGSGRARISNSAGDSDETIEWGEKDCFYLPPWRWHSFRNASSSEPLILFSIDDHPLLHATQLHREEAR